MSHKIKPRHWHAWSFDGFLIRVLLRTGSASPMHHQNKEELQLYSSTVGIRHGIREGGGGHGGGWWWCFSAGDATQGKTYYSTSWYMYSSLKKVHEYRRTTGIPCIQKNIWRKTTAWFMIEMMTSLHDAYSCTAVLEYTQGRLVRY